MAHSCGLIDRYEPISTRELIPEFSWKKLKKDNIALQMASGKYCFIVNDDTIMDMPVKGMGISARARNCLDRAGCEKVSDVVAMDEEAIWRTRNMGVATAGEIARWLQDQGLEYSAWRRFI